MYLDLLNRFTEYQNDAVKHGEAWNPEELEFMVYLTFLHAPTAVAQIYVASQAASAVSMEAAQPCRKRC
jgi:hypothetical protein